MTVAYLNFNGSLKSLYNDKKQYINWVDTYGKKTKKYILIITLIYTFFFILDAIYT